MRSILSEKLNFLAFRFKIGRLSKDDRQNGEPSMAASGRVGCRFSVAGDVVCEQVQTS